MYYRGKKNRGKIGEEVIKFSLQTKSTLLFRPWTTVQNFMQKIATVGATTDTLTDWQTDASDFITCHMLCYSNGTDEYFAKLHQQVSWCVMLKCRTTYFSVQLRDAFMECILVGLFVLDVCLQRLNFFREFGISLLQLFDLFPHATNRSRCFKHKKVK